MNSHLRPVGIDEQVQAALVATQLDFGKSQEIHEVLREIRGELERIAVDQQKRAGVKSRRSARVSRVEFDALASENERLTVEVGRLAAIVTEILDEGNFSSVARVRALQNSIMDRLAIVDALVAKVETLERSARNG